MDVEKAQSQSDDENFTNSTNSPHQEFKLTTINSSNGLENLSTTRIAIISTILSKMIPTITEFTRENIRKLEKNIMSLISQISSDLEPC